MTTTVRVSPASGAYDIVIGARVLDGLGERAASVTASRRAFVIHDAALPDAVIERALASLESAGFDAATSALAADERRKSIDTVSRLLHECALASLDRHDPIIALGGGLTGDVAGFVAATYKRGCPVIQCPTTLLAMVDAAVGGKTGVNLLLPDGLRKNLVGAFHQPRLVLADLSTLETLPDRELRAGLGECLKHGLIARPVDPELWSWTAANLQGVFGRNAAVLAKLVERNVRVKAHYVAADEREIDAASAASRMMLNLGHTFAHALEALPGLAPPGMRPADPAHLLHGEAVAYGLIAAAAASRSLNMLSAAYQAAIVRAVGSVGLRVPISGALSVARAMEVMRHDKKAASGRLRLVLPVSIGECRVVEAPPVQAVEAGLSALCDGQS